MTENAHRHMKEDHFWQTDNSARFAAQIDFLIEADKIKKIFRQTRLVHDQRYENDAEHAWHFGLYAMVLAEYADNDLDLLKVLRMALIHDLVEIDAGDAVLYDKAARKAAEAKEVAAAERIFGLLPDDQAADLRAVWDEFEARETPEARFAAAMDRVQPLMNNYMTQGYTWKKHNVTYDMVIEANGHIADGSPQLWDFILAMLDRAVEKGVSEKNLMQELNMDPVKHIPLTELMSSDIPVPDWWASSEEQIQSFLDTEVAAGRVETLAVSPGGRRIQAVFYGKPEKRESQANFNSAIAGRNCGAFCDREDRVPVLMILAGTHGAEFEGMVASLSLIRILETGKDLRGEPQPGLRDLFADLRLVIIPCANPDGRARVPYNGFVGLPTAEMTKVNQGTRKDGTLWGWPGCKQVHPMRGDVAFLGGYFDDTGINLLHDEWWNPMSPVTAPLLNLVREEAPDILFNLHSHANPPAVLKPAYTPSHVKERIAGFARLFIGLLDQSDIHPGPVPGTGPDGEDPEREPPFNLTSALYHAGAALPMTVEFPHGFNDREVLYNYEQILTALHALFEAGAVHLNKEC